MTPQRFGKQLFATTTFCTWLEACDTLGTGELHQSLPSLTAKKKHHLEPFPYLKTQQFSDEENEAYIKHSEIFNHLWDLIGPDFLLVLEQPQRQSANSRMPEGGKLILLLSLFQF